MGDATVAQQLALTGDDDVDAVLREAYERFLKTTTAPDYQAPEYRPTPTPIYREPKRDRRPTTVGGALREIERIDAMGYQTMGPPLTIPAIKHAWDQYRHRYGLYRDPTRNDLQWAQMHAMNLNLSQWHAVFQAVNREVSRNEQVDQASFESSAKIPSELILSLAATEKGFVKDRYFERLRAVRFLREQGIDPDELDPAEATELQAQDDNSHDVYSRTYL